MAGGRARSSLAALRAGGVAALAFESGEGDLELLEALAELGHFFASPAHRTDAVHGGLYEAVHPDLQLLDAVGDGLLAGADELVHEGREGLRVDMERLAYWQGKGAKLSDTAARLEKQFGSKAS